LKKRFLLRLNPAIYEALEKWAADDLRSVNGQIEYLLLQALRKAGRPVVQKAESKEEPEDPDDA